MCQERIGHVEVGLGRDLVVARAKSVALGGLDDVDLQSPSSGTPAEH
jgi:hypothetical protein